MLLGIVLKVSLIELKKKYPNEYISISCEYFVDGDDDEIESDYSVVIGEDAHSFNNISSFCHFIKKETDSEPNDILKNRIKDIC